MSSAHRIFTNTAWQIVIRFFDVILGVINIGLITRLLGQTQFGYYTTIFVFLQTIMTLADFGLFLALLNEISSTKDQQQEAKRLNNIFTIRLISAALILALAPLLIKLFPFAPAVKEGVVFLLAAYFCQSLISTLTAVFSKYLDMAKATVVYLVAKGIYFFSLLYLFFNHGNLNQVLLWNSISTGLGFLLFYIFLRRYQKLTLAWDFVYWRHVLKIAWPLAIGVVLNLLYFKADTLILSAYHSAEKVGLYGAAYKVLEVLTTFPHMFMSLILPLFTIAWTSKNLVNLHKIQQNTYDFFAIINIWVVLVVWLASRPIMVLLTGEEFALAGPILNLLILAVVAIFFGTMFTYLVVALGKQKEMVKYYLAAAIIGLSLYFIFIPKYYYWAAALSTVLVEILIWYWAWRLVRKQINITFDKRVLKRSLLVGFLSFVLFWPFKDMPVVILVFLVSLIYFLGLYLFKVIDKEKINLILGKDKYA